LCTTLRLSGLDAPLPTIGTKADQPT